MGHISTLTGRVVLVTGEGEPAPAVTASLVARGARVAVAGAPVPRGSSVLALPFTPSDAAGPGRVVDTVVERLGRLDHVVNLVAGRPRTGPLMELDPLDLRETFQRDLVMPLSFVQRAYRRWMAAHGGSVVNVVAATGRGGARDATLAGLTELTESLAAELAPRVDVHTLIPSPSLDAAAHLVGLAEVLCDLLTHRMDPAQGPVLVLSAEPDCASRAA
ncbi:SDR family NAD(P)-dependent oxidoreductase [Streptomyces sp. GXMU-J15]|uniref:SDR family NAD(P)-dependent oxidoreductase n=1 Tax=Streptomyces fuscus TaxID=3048495 RepID=A0ABT7J4U7_9ACTN|nr:MULTISPECIES: SDR family NAD(P)-dependent oxidoreductase [Streptomyces]MDL2079775.1 SDR family NAD(P)-dependent oxidoreductase [Streptomyces fuscus]SBT90298.1 NAD(P)-dependent dehydrogenase, short-chain alcohol dehydrogenase family [Streptomyces sp. DI166]